MSEDHALQLMAALFWNGLAIAGPILGVTLLVGLAVSVFQAITQLQEMSLTYIPKLGATVLMLLLLGGWMLGKITAFARSLFASIPSLG